MPWKKHFLVTSIFIEKYAINQAFTTNTPIQLSENCNKSTMT